MKLNFVKVKCIAVGVITLGAVQFSHAKGDFIPFPINCTAQGRMDQTSEIQVSIRIDQGGIAGHLKDGHDWANVTCQKIPTTIQELNYLSCVGVWESDGSKALLSTPLYTYVPMTRIQRSLKYNAEILQGICSTR